MSFCTFYCEPLATWYTFKYFDDILTHFVKSRSPGIFAGSIVSVWHFGKSKYLDHHVLHTPEISMEAFQIWKGFVITKSVFLQSKSDAQLLRLFCPLDQTIPIWSYHLIGLLIVPS